MEFGYPDRLLMSTAVVGWEPRTPVFGPRIVLAPILIPRPL